MSNVNSNYIGEYSTRFVTPTAFTSPSPITSNVSTLTPTYTSSSPMYPQGTFAMNPNQEVVSAPSKYSLDTVTKWSNGRSGAIAAIASGATLAIVSLIMAILLGIFHLANNTLSAQEEKQLNTVKWSMLVMFIIMFIIGLVLIFIGWMMYPRTPRGLEDPNVGTMAYTEKRYASSRATGWGLIMCGLTLAFFVSVPMLIFVLIWHVSTNGTPLPAASQKRLNDMKWILVIAFSIILVIGIIIALIGFFLTRVPPELQLQRATLARSNAVTVQQGTVPQTVAPQLLPSAPRQYTAAAMVPQMITT